MIPDAVACALAGVRAVDPFESVATELRKRTFSGSITVVAVGKAAVAMARGAQSVLGPQIHRGIVIAPMAADMPEMWESYVGGHPIPNEQGMTGARAIAAMAASLGSEDTVLCLVSGGASALMMLPADGMTLGDMQDVTNRLLRAGATIGELNCVRKHLDQLKGGRLAALASPARVIALILSDVVGDPLDVIASGPTVADPTTIADAIEILQRRGVWDHVAPSVRRHLEKGTDESPKSGDPRLASVECVLVGNNQKAAQASASHAASLGYKAAVLTTMLTGEARDVGIALAREAFAMQRTSAPGDRHALIYAGETTVTVTGSGIGGRNQEVVLAAAIALEGTTGITVTSIGTDGIDGPTDAAGAWTDGAMVARARTKGLNPESALAENDAYPFLQALDALVMTGPTGTNVMDLVVVTVQ